ncbi:hypothetical protein ACIGG9_15975 [Pseudonocardia alni]|uniref:hypothetical protein n=1 Tax=Pseudonocardia alni TaxID=33907 RepID=UPI0033DB7A5B
MADQRRFDSLEQTAALTAQRLDDTSSTLLNRMATHTHVEPNAVLTTNFYDLHRSSRAQGDTANRWEQFADGYMKWGPGNADPDVFLYRETANVLAVDPGDSLRVRGALVHEQPFARYYCGVAGGQNIVANGAPQNIPFTVALETHSEVIKNGNTTFTLGRAGVWQVSGGYRLSSGAAANHQLMIYNGSSSTVRYAESQQNPGSGNNVTVTRRFGVGAVVALGLAIAGSTNSTIATDVPESTHISLMWLRP